MNLTPVLETGVIDQIGTSVLSRNDRVVTLRAFAIIALGLIAPRGIGTEDVDTTITVILIGTEVQQIRREDSLVILGVLIRTVGLL